MNSEYYPAIANGETLAGKYPQGVNWTLDLPETDLGSLLKDIIAKQGRKESMEFMGKRFTYAQLNDMINRAARGLQDKGVKPGTKVGLYMPNTPYYPVMMMAALLCGATVVNYDISHPYDKMKAQAKDSETGILVVTDLAEHASNAENLLKENVVSGLIVCPFSGMLPFPKNWLFPFMKKTMRPESATAFSELTRNSGKYDKVKINPDDIAVLQYTGGTTGGPPKGAMLSHRNLIANISQIDSYMGAGKGKPAHPSLLKKGEETMLAVLPFFHVYSMMINLIGGLYFGGRIVMVPDPTDIKTTMKTIRKQHPTLLPVVPKLMMGMLEHGGALTKEMFASVKIMMSGGAALAPALREKFAKATGLTAIQGYGLSETSPVLSSHSPMMENDADSVGLPYPGTEIKIVELVSDYAPDVWPQQTLKIGETGEILVKGPQVMSGYYKKDEQNRSVLRDAWFRTGDVGHISKDGVLTITDRNKDMIDINAKKVSSLDIQKKIERHPAVIECAVVGVKDDRSGQAAMAFVRFKADMQAPTEAEMRAFFDQIEMGKYEKPKHLVFVTEPLPRTRVGKLFTPDIKKMAAEALSRKTDAGSDTAPNAPQIS